MLTWLLSFVNLQYYSDKHSTVMFGSHEFVYKPINDVNNHVCLAGVLYLYSNSLFTPPPPRAHAKCGGIVLAGLLRPPTSSSTYSTYTTRYHCQTLHSCLRDRAGDSSSWYVRRALCCQPINLGYNVIYNSVYIVTFHRTLLQA